MAKKTQKTTEFEPGAWERFERSVDVVGKSPPQPKKRKLKGRWLQSVGDSVYRQVKGLRANWTLNKFVFSPKLRCLFV